MEKILILNGSPRAPRSNSKFYSELLMKALKGGDYAAVNRFNHPALLQKIRDGAYTDLVLAFPLYADAIPVPLLSFLEDLEVAEIGKKPRISVMVNCGFYEPSQNDIAVRMVRLFCKQNGYAYGSTLKIASGEATPTTFLGLFVRRKIRRFARSLRRGRDETVEYTLPVSQSLFLRASTTYWKKYGERNGTTEEQMRTMEIEGR